MAYVVGNHSTRRKLDKMFSEARRNNDVAAISECANKGHQPAKLLLADIYREQSKFKLAIKWYKDIRTSHKTYGYADKYQVASSYGDALAHIGNYSEAYKELTYALKGDNTDAVRHLIYYWIKLEDYTKAWDMFMQLSINIYITPHELSQLLNNHTLTDIEIGRMIAYVLRNYSLEDLKKSLRNRIIELAATVSSSNRNVNNFAYMCYLLMEQEDLNLYAV